MMLLFLIAVSVVCITVFIGLVFGWGVVSVFYITALGLWFWNHVL